MSDIQLGEGRIPSSLIATYVQYKKDTGAVIAWLVSHGTTKYQRLTAFSIQDLLSLTEIVKTKAVEMPGTIHFQFREAIAARTSLSKWYRRVHDHYESDDQDTCSHEHFTTCLSNIYNDLCQCCAKPKDKCRRGNKRNKSDERRHSTLNRFAALDLGDVKQSKKSHAPSEPLETKPKEDKTKCLKAPLLRLLGDTLCEAFELRKGIQDMHDLLAMTLDTWEKAALGKTSILVATFVTHLAFAEFEEIEDRLKTCCNVKNPGTFWSRYMEMEKYLQMEEEMEEDLSFQISEKPGPQSSPKTMIEDLKECWRAIEQVKVEGVEALCRSRPAHFKPRQGLGSHSNDKESVATIFKAIGWHLVEGSYHNCIIRHGSPLNDEVCLFLTSHGSDKNSLRCSFGLHLLLQSNKSSLCASPSSSLHAASRLQALKFAQQGIVSIKAASDATKFGCRCPQTIAAHLDRLLSDLEDFIKKKVFDLYFNSPWVSGSHILEMLDFLFGAGLRLFNYQNYASAVLHTYNVLQQFHLLESIPILDKLIESGLGEIIFPGGRPNRNFKACYARSLGSRLRFDTRHQKAEHRSGCHFMSVPNHIELVTEGIREPSCDGDIDHRFDIEKISLLHYIKSRRYHPTKANLERVGKVDGVKQKQHQRLAPKVLQNVTKGACSFTRLSKDGIICPDRRMQHFGKMIHAELTGTFPVAKINYFTVYLACLRIVSTISDKYHVILDDMEQGQNCTCFANALMSTADRSRVDENSPFGYKGLVEICQEAIEGELLEKDLKDFLWKDL